LAEILGQAGHNFPAAGFVLHTVYAGWRFRVPRASCFLSKACNRVSVKGGRILFMGERNFDAVGKTGEGHFQVGVFGAETLESLLAGVEDRGLQATGGIRFEAGGIRKEAGYTARRRGQAGVGVKAHVQAFRFSGHGC
jgi:hypothetical protein